MKTKSRFYDSLLTEHLATNRQMAFVSGPERVLRHLCRSGSHHRHPQQPHGRLSPWRRQPDGPLFSVPGAPVLKFYQDQLDTPFAFQLVVDTDYVQADCFARPGSPIVVPAKTVLPQLL